MGLFGTSTRKRDDEEIPSKEVDGSDDHPSKPVIPPPITKLSATADDHDRSMTDVEAGETKYSPLNETSRPPNQTHSSTHSGEVTSPGSSRPNLPSFLTMRENADLKAYQANGFER